MTVSTEFTNHSGDDYHIVVTDTFVTSISGLAFDYTCNDFTLKWDGNEEVYDSIKSSSCTFEILVESTSQYNTLLTPFTTPTTNYYVIVFKNETTLYWWGYLTPETPKINNEYFPQRVKLKAVDLLALSKEHHIWDETRVVTMSGFNYNSYIYEYNFLGKQKFKKEFVTSTPVPPNTYPRLNFGNYPAYGQPIFNPTVVEAVFSLLFERDMNPYAELYVIEHWDFRETTWRNTGGLANVRFQLDPFIFADYPKNSEALDISARKMLENICQMFNCRIMQWIGRYYLIQNEVYQHTNTVEYYRYNRDPVSTNLQPKDLANGTLTSGDLRTTVVGTGQLYPRLRGGSFSFADSAKKIELDTVFGQIGTTLREYIYSATSTLTGPNVSIFSQPTIGIPSSGQSKLFKNGVETYKGASLGWYPDLWTREDSGGINRIDNLDNHAIMSHLEGYLDVTRTMQAVISDQDRYAPIEAITYDSVDWIWSELTYSAEMDEWEGNFVEMNATTTGSPGYDEIIRQEVNNE